jgi:hypothetical protein
MLKTTILALVSLATLSAAILPATTGTALAQRVPCTASPNGCGGDNTPGGGDTFDECTAPLGHLRRVYEEQLEDINNPALVSVIPICVGADGMFRSDGNAGTLRLAIADNEAMSEALFRKNFGSDDVVGIRVIDDETVILYVFPFHHYY